VEATFTILPLMALICAFADFGLALFRWNTFQNAVREGCRYAVTFQTTGGLGQDASIKQVVEQFAMGMVKVTDTPPKILVNYYSPSDVNTPIGSGGNIPGNIVEVSIQNVSWTWLAPISGTIVGGLYAGSPLTFSVFSSDLLGAFPVGVSSVPQ
jgi:Flp pilus assembly protein TadG